MFNFQCTYYGPDLPQEQKLKFVVQLWIQSLNSKLTLGSFVRIKIHLKFSLFQIEALDLRLITFNLKVLRALSFLTRSLSD